MMTGHMTGAMIVQLSQGGWETKKISTTLRLPKSNFDYNSLCIKPEYLLGNQSQELEKSKGNTLQTTDGGQLLNIESDLLLSTERGRPPTAITTTGMNLHIACSLADIQVTVLFSTQANLLLEQMYLSGAPCH